MGLEPVHGISCLSKIFVQDQRREKAVSNESGLCAEVQYDLAITAAKASQHRAER